MEHQERIVIDISFLVLGIMVILGPKIALDDFLNVLESTTCATCKKPICVNLMRPLALTELVACLIELE